MTLLITYRCSPYMTATIRKLMKTLDHSTNGTDDSLKALKAELLTTDSGLIYRKNDVDVAYDEFLRIF